MSTDIVRFKSDPVPHKQFSGAALKLYLELTLPLILATFAVWGIMYHRSIRRPGAMDVNYSPIMSRQ